MMTLQQYNSNKVDWPSASRQPIIFDTWILAPLKTLQNTEKRSYQSQVEPKSRNLVEIAKKSTNDRNDPKSPKTTETTKATKQKILRPDDSENDQFGRKRPKMATLL